MFDWIYTIVEKGGYFGIAFLMFLENVFPPIPSELIMPMGGYASSQGELSFWGVVLAGTVGATFGQLPLYYLGRLWGFRRLRDWVESHGYWTGVTTEDLDNSSRWFGRHQGKAVFLCRLVPTLRSLISVPAGLAEMNLLKFLAFTFVGSAIWNVFLVGCGQVLESRFEDVETYLNPVSWVIVLGILFAYLWKVYKGYQATRDL